MLRDRGIHGRDAAFTTELVYGAVRMHGLYDPIIAACEALGKNWEEHIHQYGFGIEHRLTGLHETARDCHQWCPGEDSNLHGFTR